MNKLDNLMEKVFYKNQMNEGKIQLLREEIAKGLDEINKLNKEYKRYER